MADRRLTHFAMPKPASQQANNGNISIFRPSLAQQISIPDSRPSYQKPAGATGTLRPPKHAPLPFRGGRVNLQSQFSEPDDSSGRSSIRSSIASSTGASVSTPRTSIIGGGARGSLLPPLHQVHTQSRNKMLLSAIKEQHQHTASAVARGSINRHATISGSGAGGGMRERIKDERDIGNVRWQLDRMERLAESLREWGYGTIEQKKLSQLPSKDFLKITYFLVQRLSPQLHEFIVSVLGENSPEAPELVAVWRGYSSSKLVGRSYITTIAPMSWKNCCAFLDWLHTEIKLKEETAKVDHYLLPYLLSTEDAEGQPVAGMAEEVRRRKIQTRIGLDIAFSQMERIYRVYVEEQDDGVQQLFDSTQFHEMCAEKAAEALGCNLTTLAELQNQRNDLKDYIVAYKQRPTIDRLREEIVHLDAMSSKAEVDNQNAEARTRAQQQELAQLHADIVKRRQQAEEVEISLRDTEQLIANQSMSSGDAQDLFRQIEILQENRSSEEAETDRLSDTLGNLHVNMVRTLQSSRDLVRALESNLFEHGLLNYYRTADGVDVMQPRMPIGSADVDAEFSRNYLSNFSLGMQNWQEQLQRENDLNNEVAKAGDTLSAHISAKKAEIAQLQEVLVNVQRDGDLAHQTAIAERQTLELRIENDNVGIQKLSAEIVAETARQTAFDAQLRAKVAQFQQSKRENEEAEAAIPSILLEFVQNTVKPCVADTQKAYGELYEARAELLSLAALYSAKAEEMRQQFEEIERGND